MLADGGKFKASGDFRDGRTLTFSFLKKKEDEILKALSYVYEALSEKGYDPLNQIVGYLLSGDPSYITANKGARKLISGINREEIIRVAIKHCLI